MTQAAAADAPTLRRMPAPAAPPHDPYSLLLGGWIGSKPHVGWRARRLEAVEIGPGSNALVLSPAPGAERSAAEPSGSFGGLRPPINIAIGAAGEVLLLDPVDGRLYRYDPCCCEFKALPCTTAAVHEEPADPCRIDDAADPTRTRSRPRRVPSNLLQHATGIAVCGADLYIADSGHHRILHWDLQALLPRGELRLPETERLALLLPWSPGSLAFDGRGRLYAADAINRRIDRFDARGQWQRRYTTTRPPWHIAIDCEDRLHALLLDASALWATAGAGGSVVWQWQGAGGDAPAVVRWEPACDDSHELDPLTLDLRSDRLEGFGCPPLAVDAQGRFHLPCADAHGAGPLFDARGHGIRPDNLALAPRYRRRGRYFSAALDSAIDDCTWHRVELRGCIPAGCSVTLRTLTADIPLTDGEVDALDDSAWSAPVTGTTMADCRWDALIRSDPGRHAWLQLELAGDGFETPQIEAALVEYPRISLRRYLPAVFGTEPAGADFTDRFTAIFDASLRSIEGRLDTQAALFDPLSTPAEGVGGHAGFLGWLASWIGIALSRDWPERRRREYLKSAARWYPQRGTAYGLHGQLLLLLGLDRAAEGCLDERPAAGRGCIVGAAPRCVPLPLNCGPAPVRQPAAAPALLLEHFKLRRWLFAGRARLGDDSVLWGERIVNRSQLGGAAPPTPVGCPPSLAGLASSSNHAAGALGSGLALDGGVKSSGPCLGTSGDADTRAASPTFGSARAGSSRLIGTPDPLRDPLLVHANRISVFVPACVHQRPADEQALRQLLATEVPAHVQADLHFVEPRFRVGIQAMVGLDSVIARTPQRVELGRDPLGQGTVLPGGPQQRPAAGRMRVGGAGGLA